MKKFGICVLIVLLILPSLRFASADCNENRIDDPILVKFIGLSQATVAISASGNTAKCQGVARAKSNEYSLQVTMTLQRKSVLIWKSVTSWNGTGIGYIGVTLSESKSGLSVGTYRTKLYVQVYDSDGNYVESTTVYSKSIKIE